jgi:methyl-accepting chemotaxis protein
MKWGSLKLRLTAIAVAVVVVAMAALAALLIGAERARLVQAVAREARATAHAEAHHVGGWFRTRHAAVESILVGAANADPVPVLHAAQVAGGFEMSLLGFADKRMHSYPAGNRGADYVPAQRQWYRDAIAANGATVSAPYVGKSTGKLMVTFVRPVVQGGAVVGVAGGDVLIGALAEQVRSIRPADGAFAFLVDGDGQMLAHPDPAMTLKPLSTLGEGMALDRLGAREGPLAQVTLGGVPMLVTAAPIPNSRWHLVLAFDEAASTAAVRSQALLSLVTLAVAMLAAALVLAFAVGRLLRPLERVRDAMVEVGSGDGDLSRRLDASGTDELAEVARAFNRFADKLAAVIGEIRDTSESVRNASNEIALGNADLSSRTEEQASSLQQSTGAMAQLARLVNGSADAAREASGLAQQAREVAGRGGSVVGQVVSTMSEITASSHRIADIIGVIDGIAFQTNILALNAAVEAARAGEQGRGFAVVAGEVRSLAQRAAQAAREIKALIGDSVDKVEAGAQLVNSAGQTMNEILQQVERVTGLIGEISSGTMEQSSSVTQVNQAVGRLDQMTQQNAALVEQSAAAAQSLKEQADRLHRTVASLSTSGVRAG